jgi:hypothetical protein
MTPARPVVEQAIIVASVDPNAPIAPSPRRLC